MKCCLCSNVRIRHNASDETIVESNGNSFKGPVHLSLGGITFEFAVLVSEKPHNVDVPYPHVVCLNCDMVVYITRDGQHFVNVNAPNVPPQDASPIFGIVIGKTEDKGAEKPGKVKDVKLNRLLDSYRMRVQAEKEEKIRKFAEQCELEAQQLIDASIEDSKRIWRKMQSLPVNIPQTTSWAPAASVDPSARVEMKSSRDMGKAEASASIIKPAAGAAVAAGATVAVEKGKDAKKVQIKVSETRRGSGSMGEKKHAFAKSVPASKSGFMDSIWALDEELEEEPLDDKEAHAFNATVDDDSDDHLTASDSGLLPGSKTILFGEADANEDRKSKIVLAQSLPVHVPSFGRRANAGTSSGGNVGGGNAPRGEDSVESDEFQRPDVLAHNTYKEEIRSEWLAKSKLNNEDDLEFLQAVHENRPKRK